MTNKTTLTPANGDIKMSKMPTALQFLFHELKSLGVEFLIKYLRAILETLAPDGSVIIVDTIIEYLFP